MDTPIQQQNSSTDTIDMVFDILPEGVEDFMWSVQYDELVEGIKKTLSLTDQQTELVKEKGRDLIARLKELPDVALELVQSGVPKELAAKILYLIDEGILQPVAAVVAEQNEATTNEEVKDVSPEDLINRFKKEPAETSNPETNILSSLKERITVPTTIKPLTTPVQQKPTSQTENKATVDPYRELPQ